MVKNVYQKQLRLNGIKSSKKEKKLLEGNE